MEEKKVYYRPPSARWWRLKRNPATPESERIPFEDIVRTSIAWDMRYSYDEIVALFRSVEDPDIEALKKKHYDLYVLAERLFSRSQTVDWIVNVLGGEGALKKWYPLINEQTTEGLRMEIERLYYATYPGRRSWPGPWRNLPVPCLSYCTRGGPFR